VELTAFTSRLGIGQGRIHPTGATPTDGDYVFVLGDDEPGRFFELEEGDMVQVTQSLDMSDVKLLRANLRFRMPEKLSIVLETEDSEVVNYGWEASIVVDNQKFGTIRSTKPGSDRIVTDLVANVSKLSGVHEIGVRLELFIVA
jgi:hypothetical protein